MSLDVTLNISLLSFPTQLRIMYEFILYSESASAYTNSLEKITGALDDIKNKWGINYKTVDVGALSPSQIERAKDDIRRIAPQIRGKIVTSRNTFLPLSRSKNLNTKNTPILVLYQNRNPVNVYPHMLGTAYFDIVSELANILRIGLEAHIVSKGILEEPMQKILADNPSILGVGVSFKGVNEDVGFGVADVLLQDEKGRTVVVEIETNATEMAVAQVQRLAAGFASQNNLPVENLRMVILCQNFDARTAKACQGTNVELYKLVAERVC